MICPHCRKETNEETPIPPLSCGCILPVLVALAFWMLYEGAIKIFIARILTGHWNG